MRGSVYKRGSTWTWHVDIGVDPVTGKRRQQTKGGFKTKRECQAALHEALAALRAGTFVEPSKRTLESFLVDEWLPALRHLRPSTLSNYRTHIRTSVLPTLGPIPLQQLSPAHLNAFYQALLSRGRLRDGQGMAPKTVQNVHAILHRALKDAMRWGYAVRNVADAVDPPKGLPAERQVWTPEQLRAFLSHVRDDRLYAAWLLVATTGLRRAELAGLRWLDVDLAVGRVSPRRPRVVVDYTVVESDAKTPKGRRSLALDPATLTALKAHRARQAEEKTIIGAAYRDSGLVFTMPDGSPIHPQRISAWFLQHTRAAGLPRIRLHDVRHSYATAALAAGVPPKVISQRLGHATIAITMDTYSHVIPGLDEQAAETVARLILGDGEVISDLSANKPLATGPSTD
ncbi:MAG TPA: site-specific integrase [Actinomycetota bacterium]|nr:site-specific integrase [Actinomycetota bacterium]